MAWAAAAVIFGGAPHLFAVAPWVPLLVLSLATWRIAAAARGWRLPPFWLRLPVTLLGFAGVLLNYRSISGVDAGAALLLVMAGLKLLETRTERDRVLLVFIGYFLLFAVFLREQAMWSLAWLATGMLGVTAALAQTVRREALLPATGSITLATRLALQALPLAALMFVLFPRIPGPFWALPSTMPGGVTGLAEEVSPGDVSRLSLSDDIAFRVRFDDRVPANEALYWRGPVLERFDGRTWSAFPPLPDGPAPDDEVARGTAVDYQLVLEPQGHRWLLALESPVRWSMPRATLTRAAQLLSAEPVAERVSYRARSIASGTLRSATDKQALADNLRLPRARNPRTMQLARELRGRTADDRAFLAAALQLFRDREFVYSLSPPALGREPVDDFLFTTRNGFCEHYASALAVLARAAGLPARVVVGYQGAEHNPLGDHWIVRQANAHAWVEVWLDGAWRRVDPTAAVAPDRIERGIDDVLARSPQRSLVRWRSNFFMTQVVLSWDAVNAAWDRWVLGFGPETQNDLLRALGFEVPRPIQLAVMAAAASIACLVVMAFALRQRERWRADANARLYALLCRRVAAVVRPRGKSETAAHYAAAIAAARPDLGAEVREITELYLRLRYGGAPDPELRRRLASRVRRFRPPRSPAPA
jgi:transglutaminase-like putative cysteine protease